MKFNKFSFLVLCFVFVCFMGIVSAHDNSCMINNATADNSTVQIDNGTSDLFGYIWVDVYMHYDSHKDRFKDAVSGAHVYLYGWKSHKLITSGVTNNKGEVKLHGEPCSRYHLKVVYPTNTTTNKTVTCNCDVQPAADWLLISPGYSQSGSYIIHL